MIVVDFNNKEITSHINYDAYLIQILKSIDLPIRVMLDTSASKHRLSLQLPIDASWYDDIEADLVVFPHCDHDYYFYNGLIERSCLNEIKKPNLVMTPYQCPQLENQWYCPFWPMYYPQELKNQSRLVVKRVQVQPNIFKFQTETQTRIPTDEQIINFSRQFTYSCLNNVPKSHRLINLLSMLRFNVGTNYSLDENIITMSDSCMHPGWQEFDPNRLSRETDIINVWPDVYDFYKTYLVNNLPITHPAIDPLTPDTIGKNGENHWNICMVPTIPAYLDSYVNVVTEFADSPFISEKTLKPIAAGQLFVVTGPPGTLELIRSLGFDTFDDVLEHDRYANNENIFDRTRALHQWLNQIAGRDWAAIYQETAARRLANSKLLLSGTIQDQWLAATRARIIEILDK